MSQNNITPASMKKILIVEDEADICLLLNIILKEDNVEIEHAKSIAAAKKYLQQEPVDLVILDNRLPDGLGIDFIDELRKDFPSLKILMISGFKAATAKDLALHNGADGFLEKPFSRQQVYDAVNHLLFPSEAVAE